MSKTLYFVIICIIIFEVGAVAPFSNVLLKDWFVRLLIMWTLVTQIFEIHYLKQLAVFCALIALMAVSSVIYTEMYEPFGNAAFVTLLTMIVSWIRWFRS